MDTGHERFDGYPEEPPEPVKAGICDKCKEPYFEGEDIFELYGDVVCERCHDELDSGWRKYLDFLRTTA